MKKLLLYFLVVIGIIFLLVNIDFMEIFIYIKSISIYLLSIALILQLVTMGLIAIQWKTMVKLIDKDCKLIDILKMNVRGNVVDAITPGVKIGGELARFYDIKKRLGLSISDGAIVVALQKTASMLSFYILTLISLVWFYLNIGQVHWRYMYFFLGIILIFGIGFAIMILTFLNPSLIQKLLFKLPIKTSKKEKLTNSFKKYKNSLSKFKKEKKKFFLQIFLGVFIWILFAFKMYLIVKGLNIKLNIISIGAITYLSYVAGMIPLLPGSIGSFEATMTFLLSIKGIPVEKGLAVAVIFRFVTFWFEFFISLFFLILDKLIWRVIRRDEYAGDAL